MYSKPKESDWKIFRKRVVEWRERYLDEFSEEFRADLLSLAEMRANAGY
jgi:hypothetical protein